MTVPSAWAPPFTWRERLKYALVPPRFYLRRLVARHLRRGEPELRILPDLVPPDRVAIDVGANKGVYSHVLSRLCPRVEAFEPNPKIYAILVRALPANVRAHPVALSDADGAARLLVPRHTGGWSNQRATLSPRARAHPHGIVTVEARRLDSYGFENVGFIKIDVEGFETAVLDGAAATIARERPVLLVEIEERHTGRRIEESLAAMARFDVDGYFLRNGTLCPVAMLDPDADHRRAVKTPRYVNNFIFLPR